MSKRLSLLPAIFLCVLSVIWTGCGEGEESNEVIVIQTETPNGSNVQNPNQNSSTVNPTTASPEEQSQMEMMLGIRGGALTQGAAEEMTIVMADSVLFASQNVGTGLVITTGTITQQGQNIVYSAAPNDRLVLQLSDTPAITFYISELNGDLSSVDNLVKNDHQINFRVETEAFDLSVNSVQNGINRAGSLNGSITLNTMAYQVQVQRAEQVVAGVGFGAAEHESEAQLSGLITSENQFRLELNESYRYKFIIFDNAVENVTFTSNNSWSSQGNNYALADAMIRYETLNGWPNPSDYWVAQGQLIENGQVLGQIGMERKPLWIEVFLQMTTGERIEIDRHILQGDN